ncbi:MAG: glycoside hydrolase family 43 C-terminal domain-containing protein [Agathobacter sp.]|nr:glycoside hydrolase family 43 C-terminal domain-containing protein [Agathobacter sp.]
MEGTWSMKNGTCYMRLIYDEVEYSGVICEMKDEAGTNVMTFSAVGNNESIWGVKYEQ